MPQKTYSQQEVKYMHTQFELNLRIQSSSMAPLSYICRSIYFCYTDLFCCSSRRQSLSAPTATTTWTSPKLETMSLDGCMTLYWDTLRFFVESRIPTHVRAYQWQAAPRMVTCPRQHTTLRLPRWRRLPRRRCAKRPGPARVLSLGATKHVELLMATAAEEPAQVLFILNLSQLA
jgi:hypothetical protein